MYENYLLLLGTLLGSFVLTFQDRTSRMKRVKKSLNKKKFQKRHDSHLHTCVIFLLFPLFLQSENQHRIFNLCKMIDPRRIDLCIFLSFTYRLMKKVFEYFAILSPKRAILGRNRENIFFGNVENENLITNITCMQFFRAIFNSNRIFLYKNMLFPNFSKFITKKGLF